MVVVGKVGRNFSYWVLGKILSAVLWLNVGNKNGCDSTSTAGVSNLVAVLLLVVDCFRCFRDCCFRC